ncbi:MAG: hypothetical protein LBN19_03670 [Endomicrobium sp.]|jgi:type II secretory pathway component GspD/PulD (secretin)|nr:hypothetical protein [Endomicrobium sp.]
MIEIDVEITEINENKTRDLGIEWSGTISPDIFSIPAVVESKFVEIRKQLLKTLKILEENGAVT